MRAREALEAVGLEHRLESLAVEALGRRAPARRDRPRARRPPGDPVRRRAHRQPRLPHRRGHPRAAAGAARGGLDDRDDHARPRDRRRVRAPGRDPRRRDRGRRRAGGPRPARRRSTRRRSAARSRDDRRGRAPDRRARPAHPPGPRGAVRARDRDRRRVDGRGARHQRVLQGRPAGAARRARHEPPAGRARPVVHGRRVGAARVGGGDAAPRRGVESVAAVAGVAEATVRRNPYVDEAETGGIGVAAADPSLRDAVGATPAPRALPRRRDRPLPDRRARLGGGRDARHRRHRLAASGSATAGSR